MTEAENADTFQLTRKGLTLPEFELIHPYPFLVFAPTVRNEKMRPSVAATPLEFHTQVHRRAETPVPPSVSLPSDGSLILPIRKSPNNPFPDRISLGRAPNCDIVVRDPSVSKLHGHFRTVDACSVIFTDAKSANGTRREGETLTPGEGALVEKGNTIIFGRVRFRLSSAAEVFELL